VTVPRPWGRMVTGMIYKRRVAVRRNRQYENGLQPMERGGTGVALKGAIRIRPHSGKERITWYEATFEECAAS